MSPGVKKLLIGCIVAVFLAGGLFVGSCFYFFWWIQKGAPVVEQSGVAGPETQAFVTFLARPNDKALLEVFDNLQKRARSTKTEAGPAWVRSLEEFLSGAQANRDAKGLSALLPIRVTGTIEAPAPGEPGHRVLVVSLGKMSNFVKVLLSMADSERERETYEGVKILLPREAGGAALALVDNNLVVSNEATGVRTLVHRLKSAGESARPSEEMASVLGGIASSSDMPGLGGIVNNPAAATSLWQTLTGAPEGSEIALPDDFHGFGFRFRFVSADAVGGDGSFYFADEESASGAKPAIENAIVRVFTHYGLKPKVRTTVEGSRLLVEVEAYDLDAALDRLLKRPAGL